MHRQLSKRHSFPLPTRSLSIPLSLDETNSTSSHFSEIEQINAQTPEEGDLPGLPKVEPVIRPLTEINLKYHTESVSVEATIQSIC